MSEMRATQDQTRKRVSLYDNLGSAILALFLAILVWVVATYEANPPKTGVIQGIPIEIRNKPSNLQIMNSIDGQVEIEIRAPQSSWEGLDTASFDAFIDLRNIGEGISEVEVQVSCPSDPVVTFLDRTPAGVYVALEEVITKRLTVSTHVVDSESVPLGYISRPPTVLPASITVSGPRSIVEKAQQATLSIQLEGARETVELALAPTIRDTMGNIVEGLEVSPALVQTEVHIERQLGYRDVTVSAITTGSPAPGYWVSNIAVDPPAITVYGKPQIIEAMSGFLVTNPIDIEGVDETLIKRVPLALPEGVSVFSEDISGQTVNVHIEITPQLGGQTIRQQVEHQGLGTGFRVILSPEGVDVILSGPLPELQTLSPEDVKVVLNLLGLRVGTFKLEPTILLPEGSKLEVKNFQPETIEVTIELQPTEVPTATPSPETAPTPTAEVTPTPTETATPTLQPERGP